MTDIKNLVGEKKKYKIGGQEIYLEPLDLFKADDGFDLLIKISGVEGEEKDSAIKEIFTKTLERNKVSGSLAHGVALLKAVMDVNGLSDKE